MTDMSASIEFSVKYDGPALAEHRMDVRELAPALLALSSLLEESNKSLYGDKPEVRVNVKGNFQSGSFKVNLEAALTMKEQIVTILAGSEATAVSNLFGILGGLGLLGGGGVLGLLFWLRGRKPSRVEFRSDKAVFYISEDEHVDSLEVDLEVHRLYTNRNVRQSFAKVIKPLTSPGIDYFASGRNGVAEAVVTKSEAETYFEIDDDAEVVSNTVTERTLLQIESAVFKDGNKWRLSDGSTSFFAEIADREFLDQIELGQERFGKGDVLVVTLRRIQTIADTGLKSEYVVEKVIEHREPLQMNMFRPPPVDKS